MAMADSIRYRQVRLVVLLLDRESVTRAATVYFPSSEFEFTRLSEPRNRSTDMSPLGKTSLLAEIPCHEEEEIWRADDQSLGCPQAEAAGDGVHSQLGRFGRCVARAHVDAPT